MSKTKLFVADIKLNGYGEVEWLGCRWSQRDVIPRLKIEDWPDGKMLIEVSVLGTNEEELKGDQSRLVAELLKQREACKDATGYGLLIDRVTRLVLDFFNKYRGTLMMHGMK